MWVAQARVTLFAERGVMGYQRPGNFLLVCVFLLEYFFKRFDSTLSNRYHSCLSLPPPQVNQELPCWHNYKVEEGGKAEHDEDWGGDFCHSEGQRDR